MALSSTARGTGTLTTSNTTFVLTPSSYPAAGSLLVLVLTHNNSGTSGAAPTVSVADSQGNTWTRYHQTRRSPGNASNDGSVLEIWTTPQDKGTLVSANTITMTYGTATASKCGALWEVTAAANYVATYLATGTGAGGASTTPSVTTGTIVVGDMTIGAVAYEYGQAPAGSDTDTNNGSWSTRQNANIGSTTSGMSVCTQTKVQTTADSTQTYNPTYTNSSDWAAGWISVDEVPWTTAPAGAATGTGSAPTATSQGQPTAGAASGTGSAPTAAGFGGTTAPAGVASGVGAAQWGGGAAPTVAFVCGAECDLTHWTTKAYATADATHVRSGTYGLRITTTGGLTGWASYNHANQRTIVCRVAFYAGTFQNLARIIDLYVQTAANYHVRYKDADQKLYLGNGTTETASTNTVSTGTWYVLDIRIDMSANPHVVSWKIDGTAQTGCSPALAADYFQKFSLGDPSSVRSNDTWFDDAVLSFTSGDYPISDGAATGSAPEVWTPAGGALAGPTVRVQPSAAVAAATGTAPQVAAQARVEAGASSGTGSAPQPTVATLTVTTAPAGAATGTGSAPTISIQVRPAAGTATGTGSTPVVTVGIQPTSGAATGTGSAHQPTVVTSVSTTAPAGAAIGTGSAGTATARIMAFAPSAIGEGAGSSAFDSDTFDVDAFDGGPGASIDPTVQVRPTAGVATGTGTAPTATIRLQTTAGAATGTGTAHQPTIRLHVTAGAATATGTAQSPTTVSMTPGPYAITSSDAAVYLAVWSDAAVTAAGTTDAALAAASPTDAARTGATAADAGLALATPGDARG